MIRARKAPTLLPAPDDNNGAQGAQSPAPNSFEPASLGPSNIRAVFLGGRPFRGPVSRFEDEELQAELLSMSRMARRLGVAQRWLREQADAGNVPGIKVSNRYLFHPPAVREAVALLAAKTGRWGEQ